MPCPYYRYAMRGLAVLEQTYLRVFRVYPFMIPLAVVMCCAETGYAAVNNFGLPLYVDKAAWQLGVPLGAVGKTVGLIISIFLITETACRLPLGMLSDRVGRKTMIVAGPLVGCAAMLAMAYVGNWRWMVPIRAVDGMAAAALWPSIFALIGDRVARQDRATAMSVTNTVYLGGIALGPTLAGAAIGVSGSARAPFLLASVSFFLGGMIAIACLPAGRAAHPEENEAAEVRVPWTTVAVMLVLMFAQTFGAILLAPFLSLYGKRQLHLQAHQISLLFMLPAAVVALLAMPLGRLADRVPRDVAVKAALCVAAVGMWLVPFARSLVEMVVIVVALAMAYAFAIPAWFAMVTEVSPRQGRGETLGKFGIAQGLGAMVAPFAGGVLYDREPRLPFAASAALLTLAALLACAALPRAHTTDRQGQ